MKSAEVLSKRSIPRFFAVTEHRALRKSAAYAEPIEPRYKEVPQKCPKCGASIANLRWLPPYEIWLKKPNAVADVVPSFGGPELLVSEPLACVLSRLKGVEQISSVRVAKVGTRKSSIPPPRLFVVQVVHSHVRVDFDACETTWSSDPDDGFCRYCGPGGGGSNGCFWSFERIVLDLQQWDGEEIFYPINLAGTLIATDDAVRKALLHKYRNVSVTPIEDYRYSYGSKKDG